MAKTKKKGDSYYFVNFTDGQSYALTGVCYADSPEEAAEMAS